MIEPIPEKSKLPKIKNTKKMETILECVDCVNMLTMGNIFWPVNTLSNSGNISIIGSRNMIPENVDNKTELDIPLGISLSGFLTSSANAGNMLKPCNVKFDCWNPIINDRTPLV